MNLSTADLRNYWTEFDETWWSTVFWQPFWKWQTSWKFWKRTIAPLMVTYHYVKLYVSIIIHLEVININVRNVNFPLGFYSNPHPLWTPQNMTLTPFTTKLKILEPTKWAVKIQHCPISSQFDMWVDNDVPNWFPTLKNFYRSPFSKWPPQYGHFSMSGIISGHHNLPTYQMTLKSDNVEFVRYYGGHFGF
jgi:hypothetical protein